MSSDSFPSVCKDFTTKAGKLIPGCGQAIIMKKYPDGKWHPHNTDAEGTPHKHSDAPKAPATATAIGTSSPPKPNGADRPYYQGIEEVALETDVKSVNNYLKSGWVILRIAERQGFAVGAGQQALSVTNPATGPVMQVSEVCFILGKRSG